MPDITLKEFYTFVIDNSQNKDSLILYAKPDGGGGYTLQNITKENWFKLTGHPLDFNVAGSTDIITFSNSGGGYKLVYIGVGASSVLMGTMPEFGIGDGATFAASLRKTGSIGALALSHPLGDIALTARDLNPLLKVAAIANAEAVTSLESKYSYLKLVVDGGTIATGEIDFPESASNADIFKFYVEGTITALTLDAEGSQTIDTTITTITDGGAEYSYNEDDTEWKLIARY